MTEFLPPPRLGIKRALELLARPGTRLMVTFTLQSPQGRVYTIGDCYLEPSDAEKLIKRGDVVPFDDGLLDGVKQTWIRP